MNKIRILIADQLKINRDKWSTELSNDPGFDVIGGCTDSAETMQLALRSFPDAVMLDINYTGIPSFHTIPKVPLSSLKEMIRSGANGHNATSSSGKDAFLVIVEITEGDAGMALKLKILFLNNQLVKSMITVKKVLFLYDSAFLT